MKLIESYSKTTGLDIKTPFLAEKFYPLSCQKYITIQNGSGMPNAKNYDYWQEVLILINKQLTANNIGIVLLGSSEDLSLDGVIDLRGKTDLQQSNYLIKRSLLHVGNDSCLAHLAGINNIPLVALYGSTTIANHSPYWKNEEKTILIESHRCGQNPSFSNQENPKMINLIPPQQIANSILQLLGIKDFIESNTIYIGKNYQNSIIEYIPNYAFNIKLKSPIPIVIRLDYDFNLNGLVELSSQNINYYIVTDKQIDLNVLNQFRKNILSINIEVTNDITVEYINKLKEFGIKYTLFIKNKHADKLGELRMKFFECAVVEKLEKFSLETLEKECRIYLNNPEFVLSEKLDSITFKTHKIILANGKLYMSKAHYLKDTPSQLGQFIKIIDDENFWEDFEHFYFSI